MLGKIKAIFSKEKEPTDTSQELEVVEKKTREPVEIGFGDGTGLFCENCKSPLTGGFCSGCGQKNTNLARPIWYLLSDLTEDIISKDSKLFRTIGQIIFWPGSLTRDFMDGKRARFIPPVRFYLLCTLTFFVTLMLADVAILKIEFRDANKPSSIDATQPQISIDESEYTGQRMGASREEVLVGLQTVRSQVLSKLKISDRGMGANFLNKWNQEAVSTTKDGDASLTQETSSAQANPQPLMSIDESEDDVNVNEGNDDAGLIRIGKTADGVGFSAHMFTSAEPGDNLVLLPDDSFDENKASMQKVLDEGVDNRIGVFFIERSIKALDGLIHVSQDPRRLNNTLNDWLSKIMIFLLPFFAVLLRVFYWSRNNCLMKQLVFSLHFHSAIFLMMTFLVLAQVFWGAAFSTTVFFLFVPVYLFIAMKVANKQGIIRTFFKFALVSFLYMLTLIFAVSIGIMLSLSEI